MYEKILVPLDGSKAAKSGAEIVLTEVFESKSENELAASRAYLKNTAVQGQINLKSYGARTDTKIGM